ncbi:MAG: HpcH/HpaI aldolase/citrate lyase family protein [Solirubrobacterales bacterium]
MKHHGYCPDYKFALDPIEFNKYTNKKLLQYCLGAVLYMPATKDYSKVILDNKFPGLTSMVVCFEDAIPAEDLKKAEENALKNLEILCQEASLGNIEWNRVPLIFFRPRSPEQFVYFSEKLNCEYMKFLTGFAFPKFSVANGNQYLDQLRCIKDKFNEVLYCMPILESEQIAFKETRLNELLGIRNLVEQHIDLILNMRVGATDLSSYFGVRRGMNYSIYDILPVKDCISDILNIFTRDDNYVVSAPVWEYFGSNIGRDFKKFNGSIQQKILKRSPVVNDTIDGLLREVIIDKANGFIGKTIIHPSHIKYVNSMQTVLKEEYVDAMQILKISGGVVKSPYANKMNEINPHRHWADKICLRAQAYGVIDNECEFLKLFS